MTEQDRKIIETMQKYGGSFIQRLAAAFIAADPENKGIIKGAFEADFNRYLAMAEAMQEVGDE